MSPPGVREAAFPPPFFPTKAGQIRREALFFVISISKAIIEQPVSSLETGGDLCLLFEEVFVLFVHKLAVRWEVVVHVR